MIQMPRLSKIRLTGCRYEGLQKEHENSVFDLTKDDKADHSLFTLANGGGKGVMMQLIFQILLPKTRWGKNNGNKVISMFYDNRNNLHQFTFHVVLEWILDTIPEKKLLTGIAVKSIIKNTTSEEESNTGLSYFVYTHEHENDSPFTVENLPLYDFATKEAVDIGRMDEFLNNNKRDFTKYSKTSIGNSDSAYYSYLASRGIYRSEWLKLKEINKSEGGSGDYFTGAGDNKSIFDKIIIPAISENIKNYSFDEGDNLIEMFKSNLSITKDLPILMKREGDFKELLFELKPLIQNADIGSKYIDIKERLINEGNDIYFILKDEQLFVDEEIVKWEGEFKKTKRDQEDLEYKRDNLYYNQLQRQVEVKRNRSIDLDKSLKEKSIEIENKKEEEISYKVNRVLYQRKKVENEIMSKSMEKEKLVQTLDIEDIKAKAEDLDSQIEIEWDKTKAIWMDIEIQHWAYINYTDGIKLANKHKKNKYNDRIETLQKKDNIFILKEENLALKKRELEEFYDPLSLSFPERIYEDLISLQEIAKGKADKLDYQIKEHTKKLSKLDLDKAKLVYELANKEKIIEELNASVIEEEKFELELSRKIAKQMLENQEGGLLSHNWFNKKLESLESLKEEKTIKLESVQRTLWGKNIDKTLNKESYFIPNKDIVLIKEMIKKISINVQTGLEYLYEIGEEDKKKLLNKNPEFIYSLVIENRKDWEIIKKNIDEDIFINNMVPIFIRSQMNLNNSQLFKTIKNKSYSLTDRDTFLKWKDEMEYTINRFLETEVNIKEDIDNISKIIQEIAIVNLKDTTLILNQKINSRENEKEKLLEKLRLLEEERLNIENKILEIENARNKNKDKLEETADSIKQINEYIEKMKEIEIEKVEISNIKKEIANLKKEVSNLDEDSDNITNYQDLTKDAYWKWKASTRNIIDHVKEVFKDMDYEIEVDKTYSNHKTPNFILEDLRLKALVKERSLIEREISAKNSSIAVLDTEIKNLEKDRNRHLEELERISESWKTYRYLDLPLNTINIEIKRLKREIMNSEEEKIEIRSALDSIKGNIDIMDRQLRDKEASIMKTHSKSARVTEIQEIESEINRVKRNIESNNKYASKCQEILDKNNISKIKLEINTSKIKNGYPLEVSKGKTYKILKDKLASNPDSIVEAWISDCSNNKDKINKTIHDGDDLKIKFIKEIGNKLEEVNLKDKTISALKDAKIDNFKNNLSSFTSMENHFQKELLRLSNDKKKAEKAMEQWTDRASMHIIKMIEALEDMIASMNYTNEQGYAFPLVKLKGAERLPKEKSEIKYLLDEYFIQSISEVLEKGTDISSIEDKDLKALMGDKVIFSKALQGRYPILMVYKMSEKNEFRYARARDEYYTTWEAINKGEGDQPEGSGGQTLSVNTFVIMMIMSFKKKHIGNENPSTVLILDNPFGKASAKHVLDPIFEIADRLNFQLICFAAPEIIKVEISERFPVFWELKIEEGKVVHGGRIIKQ